MIKMIIITAAIESNERTTMMQLNRIFFLSYFIHLKITEVALIQWNQIFSMMKGIC